MFDQFPLLQGNLNNFTIYSNAFSDVGVDAHFYIFPARITAVELVDGTYYYAWSGLSFDENGDYADDPYKKSGTVDDQNLVELNNTLADVPAIVWVRERGMVDGFTLYEFGIGGAGTSDNTYGGSGGSGSGGGGDNCIPTDCVPFVQSAELMQDGSGVYSIQTTTKYLKRHGAAFKVCDSCDEGSQGSQGSQGSGSGGSGSGGGPVDACCGDMLPNILFATITESGPCSGFAGTWQLNQIPMSEEWDGATAPPAGTIQFFCNTGQFTITCGADSVASGYPTSISCDPLEITYTLEVSSPSDSPCCMAGQGDTLTITITA